MYKEPRGIKWDQQLVSTQPNRDQTKAPVSAENLLDSNSWKDVHKHADRHTTLSEEDVTPRSARRFVNR